MAVQIYFRPHNQQSHGKVFVMLLKREMWPHRMDSLRKVPVLEMKTVFLSMSLHLR
jgi:hypothetical protein